MLVNEQTQAMELWKINKNLNLPAFTAKFYVLYDLVKIQEQEKHRKTFDVLTVFLDDQIKKYLDAALGGELRHFYEKRNTISSQILDDYLKTTIGKERWQSWIEWKTVREANGTRALQEAERLFRTGSWRQHFGGKTWAAVTELLISRLTGEFSDIVFIDTAFSIDHNTGCVFNKLWSVDGQKSVYAKAFAGDIKGLEIIMNREGMSIDE